MKSFGRWLARSLPLQLLHLALIAGVLFGAAAQAGTVTYVYTDAQGTPVMEADAQGNITATYDYTPYGSQALGTPPVGPGYTGHVNDPDTGLVYMQARYYDPVAGRFLSVDPVGPGAGNGFNFGRYVYANNNPLLFTDPDGRENVLGIIAHFPKDITNPSKAYLRKQANAQRSVDLTVNAVLQGGTDEQKQNAAKWDVRVDPRITSSSATGGTATTWSATTSTLYSAAIDLMAESGPVFTFVGGMEAPGGDAALLAVGGHELAHTTTENAAMMPGEPQEANASSQAIKLGNSSPDVEPGTIKSTDKKGSII